MARKSVVNKHKSHTDKVLKGMSKNAQAATSIAKDKIVANLDPTLKDQYNVIRKDLLKLREDLAKGYDMAKSVDKKNLVKQLLDTK